jgi:hypothetical protein
VSIFEHHFASKPFNVVREKFSSAYPDKEVQNTVIKFGTHEVFRTGNISGFEQA